MTETSGTSRREVLDNRLSRYHEVSIGDVLGVIEYLRVEGDSVIAGGSLAIGLGNGLSDLDVVIAGRDLTTSAVPLEHWTGSLRIDLWTRSHADIDALFGLAERSLASDQPIAGAFGSVEEEQQLKLLHRVAFGLRIDGEPLEPSSTRDYRDIARDLVVREYAERMRGSAYVAQLALRHGNDLAASANARLAVEEVLHAALAARGVPFSGDKWMREQLVAEAPDLDAQYRPFAVLPDGDAGVFVAASTALCERISGLDLSTDTLGEEARWAPRQLSLLPIGSRRILLAADIGCLWELDESEAQCWERLVERDAWRGADCDDAQTALLVDLYERGVVSLSWGRGIRGLDLAREAS